MAELTVLSIVFLATLALVILRFTTVLHRILETSVQDRKDRAAELELAHQQAFNDAMTALESINQRVVDSQTAMFNRTMDAVAGPQTADAPVDDPSLDARVMWKPDDEFDYTGIGIDPTDDSLPDPPLEPDDNAHRAVLLPPGEGLIPRG